MHQPVSTASARIWNDSRATSRQADGPIRGKHPNVCIIEQTTPDLAKSAQTGPHSAPKVNSPRVAAANGGWQARFPLVGQGTEGLAGTALDRQRRHEGP